MLISRMTGVLIGGKVDSFMWVWLVLDNTDEMVILFL